jgi:hypothetical protein
MNGDSDKQIAFAPQTNYYSYGLFGSKTVTNAEGSEYAYTTTYEILIAYTTIGATQSDIIGFVIASVNDGGFNYLYGAANWDNEVNYVTSTGIRQLHLNGELDDTLFTDAVRSKVKHEVVGTGTVDTIAVKTSTGIAVYMTINHQQAIDTAFYGDGSDYHQYQFIEMNFGLRVGNVAAAAAYNNGTIWCWFGHKTVDNGADAAYRYTTTYEMFIPYKYFYSSNAGSTLSGPESDELSMSAYIQVDGTGACIWGCTDWWNSTCYVTDNGIVDKSAN